MRAAFLIACISLAELQAGVAAAAVYYVDGNNGSCSSSGPGTESQPYCTITSAVNAHHGPGITILVKPGTYREQVSVPASGASGSPFVVQALGQGVIVECADSFASASLWTSAANGSWLAASVDWPPLQVFVDGARLDSVATSPDSLSAGSFVWVSGQGLYVNVGGGNPGLRETLVGHRADGFTMFTKSWVTVDGFEIVHPEERGIYLQNGCTNVTISANDVSGSRGIGIQGVGGSALTFTGNVVHDNIGHGIALISGATGCMIHDNECYGNSDPATRVSNGIYLFGAPGNTLCSNRTHDNQDTGMHLQSGSNDCVAYNNVSWHNGDHGFDHLFATGITHVGDVSYGNHMDGFSIEGSATGVHLTNCISVDNGLTTSRFDLWIDGNSVTGFQSDYNIFWNSTAQAPFKYIATIYPTIAGYRSASGQDPKSLQVDPMFLDGAAGNFHLMPGSPAIDSGDSADPYWPSLDAEGHARLDVPGVANTGWGSIAYADRGAFERYSAAVDVPATVARFEGLQLSPNPMRDRGRLRLALERPGRVRIQLLDAMGLVVRNVADRDAPAGPVELEVPGLGDDGRPLQSGVYFVRVVAPGHVLQGRCLVLR